MVLSKFLLPLPAKILIKMKQFLKYVLATIIGIFISSLVVVFIGIGIIAGMSSSEDSSSSTTIDDGSVLVVKLAGNIVEHSDDNSLESLLGSATEQQGLDDIVTAIDAATKAQEIKGIYIEAGPMITDYSSLKEIRNALLYYSGARRHHRRC